MNRLKQKPGPMSVRLGVHGVVDDAVYKAVDQAVHWAVDGAVSRAVNDAVYWAVDGAVDEAMNDVVRRDVRGGRPHPNLRLFLFDIRQPRGGET